MMKKVTELKDNFAKRRDDLQNEEHRRLMVFFKERLNHYSRRYYKKQKILRNPLRYTRILKRRASEGQVNLHYQHEHLYEKFEDLKTRKKYLKEEYADEEFIPHTRNRLYHSMVWERYTFKVADEVDYNKKPGLPGNTSHHSRS